MIWPVSSGRENAGAGAPTVSGESPAFAGDLVARFTVFLGLAALTEAGLFFVIERALEVFFVEGEELFDLSLGDLLATFGLALVDELFLVDLDWRLDGMVPPGWKMNDPEHEKSLSL